MTANIRNRIAMRIKKEHAAAVIDILQYKIDQKAAFAHPRLTKDIQPGSAFSIAKDNRLLRLDIMTESGRYILRCFYRS